MGIPELSGLILIVINALATYYTLRNARVFDTLLLRVGPVLGGQWYRLLTAGFLHVNWNHLFLNLFSFFIFAGRLESFVGRGAFLIIYFAALLGGNLLSVLFHRKSPQYSAVGASGAVSGIIFASIALFPDMQLAFIFLPFYFPAWIFGIGYILYSLYGMGRQSDNIGHEAHLGGALSGLLAAVLLEPWIMESNALTIIYIFVPAVVLLILLLLKPQLMSPGFGNRFTNMKPDDHYREERAQRQSELNRILEKMQSEGRGALTEAERQFLEKESRG